MPQSPNADSHNLFFRIWGKSATELSLRNHGIATRNEEPQILNCPFQMLLRGRGERMLAFELHGSGKICFQVAAYYNGRQMAVLSGIGMPGSRMSQ